jgi:cell division protein FtsN
MGRAFKIILWIFILIVLYSILSVTYGKCTETSKDMLDKAKNGVENVTETVSDVAENANDEFFSDEGAYDDDNSELADELFDDEPQVKEEVKAAPQKTAPVEKPRQAQTYSSSDGKYMVVAGNFLVEANAGNMVRKLNNLGYSAESVVFDESQYYTVLATRSNDYNKALSVSSQLKSKGIDNYVKSQKF